MGKMKNHLTAYGFLLPALASIFLLTLLPVIYTVFISFTNYNMYHLDDFDWVGWKNYQTVLQGTIKNVFFSVLGWTICFAALSTLLSYLLGLGLAVLLNNPLMTESSIYRSILIIPWALPATIAILSWQGLLNEQYGGINQLLSVLGIAEGIPWMTDAFWARTGIILVNIWLGYPFMMNICLGALQSISPTLYEVANVEGAQGQFAVRRQHGHSGQHGVQDDDLVQPLRAVGDAEHLHLPDCRNIDLDQSQAVRGIQGAVMSGLITNFEQGGSANGKK